MHEQSETVERDGRWINVYGRNTPRAGLPLPGEPEYSTLSAALAGAKRRSEMADTMPPPDMNAAGVGTASEPASVVDALRSQGSLPAGVMSLLGQPTGGAGGAYAQAILGGLAAGRGQFGAAASGGLGPQQGQGFQQTLSLIQLLQNSQFRAQDLALRKRQQDDLEKRTKEEMAWKKREAARSLAGTLLEKGGSEGARLWGQMAADDIKEIYPNLDIGPTIAGMATRRFPKEKQEEIMTDMVQTKDNWEVLRVLHPDLTPEMHRSLQILLGNPAVAKRVEFLADYKKEALNFETNQATLFAKQYPGIEDRRVGQAAFAAIRAQGYDFANAPKELRDKEVQAAQAAEDARIKEEKKDIDARFLVRAKAMAEFRQTLAANKPMKPSEIRAALKPFHDRDFLFYMADQIEALADRLKKKGFLPKGPGWDDTLEAAAVRLLSPGDPDLRAMWGVFTPTVVGQIERGMQGDKGVRALLALGPIVDWPKSPPPYESFSKYFGLIRGAAKRLNATEREDYTNHPQLLKSIDRIIAGKDPKPTLTHEQYAGVLKKLQTEDHLTEEDALSEIVEHYRIPLTTPSR